MHAAWLENNELDFRENIPVPEPAGNEALVRVLLAGICGTDLELVRGYYPFTGIPGHEFVGEIVVAASQPQRAGQRVVGEINITCGGCRACLSGRSTHCEKRKVLGIRDYNGAFAQFLCLPLANLIPIPDAVPDAAAVFVEPLAAALEIQEQIHIRSSDRVLVLGAGRLGQLIARTLVYTGCALQISARHGNQQKCLDQSGITWLDESSVPEHAFDIAVEATGSPDGFLRARRAVRPGGTIVLKSTYRENLAVDFASVVVDEITLIGSRCGPFEPALRLLEDKRIDPRDLIEGRYALKDAISAYRRSAQPGALKVLLQP